MVKRHRNQSAVYVNRAGIRVFWSILPNAIADSTIATDAGFQAPATPQDLSHVLGPDDET
jgi:hypothetical protein